MTIDTARALSFGAIADDYDLHRPGYPPEAIRWLLAAAPGRRVVDLGAGTGKLSAVLVAEGAHVTAVEPDAGMRARFALALPATDVRAGAAESIPLADAGVDGVFAAQAFHWFDPSRALPEIARVLVPGGILGVIWNLRDEDTPWVAALSALLGSDGLDGSRVVAHPEQAAASAFTTSPLFGAVEHRTFPHAQELTEDTLVALMATRSHVTVSPAAAREELFTKVRRLCREHPDLAGREQFTLPYVTHAFWARRIAG